MRRDIRTVIIDDECSNFDLEEHWIKADYLDENAVDMFPEPEE